MGDYILSLNPQVIGFYTICNAFTTSLLISKYIKQNNCNLSIFYGGPQASVTYETCLKEFPFIDAICIGESELMIEKFIEIILSTNKDFKNVSSVAYRDGSEIKRTRSSELIDADKLHDYFVDDFEPFHIDSNERVNIEGGRGCPFSCTFCTTSTFWGRNYRLKNINDIVSEMMQINEKYGNIKFAIQHDMFTSNKNGIKEFCKKVIETKKHFDWTCSSRIDVLDKEMIILMKEANCTYMFVGIESGSPRMQKILHKNLDLESALDKLTFIKKETKIGITASFVYCFPDETIEDFKKTILLLENLYLVGIKNLQLHRFMPLPGTEETMKVKKDLYYDEDVTELTLNTGNYTEAYELIKKYPDLFSQYYTFESEVKKTYKRFDIFVELLGGMSDVYYNSFWILIKEFGLERVYFFMEPLLEQIHTLKMKIGLKEKTKSEIEPMILPLNKIMQHFFDNIILEQEKRKIFEEIYKYEKEKADYYLSTNNESYIKEFNIDIGEWILSKIVIFEPCYIRFKKTENGIVHTIRMKKKSV